MRKKIIKRLASITIAVVLAIQVAPAFATTGACSGHNGINCAAGVDTDGSVICQDGWKDSSVQYASVANECSNTGSSTSTTSGATTTFATSGNTSESSSGATSTSATSSSTTSTSASTTSNTTTSSSTTTAASAVEAVTSSVESNTTDSAVTSTVNSTATSVVDSLDSSSTDNMATDLKKYEAEINAKIQKLTEEAKKSPAKRAQIAREIKHLKDLLMQLRLKTAEKNKEIITKIKRVTHRPAVYSIRWGALDSRRAVCTAVDAKELKKSLDENEVPVKCLDGVPKADYKGTISVNIGTLKVQKEVLFEKNDKVITASGSSISFESHIAGHWDGLIVEYVPPVTSTTAVDTASYKELEVTLSIGDLNQTYKGSEIFGRKKIDANHKIEIKPLVNVMPGVTQAVQDKLIKNKLKTQEKIKLLRAKIQRLKLMNKGGKDLDELDKTLDEIEAEALDDTSAAEIDAELDKISIVLTDNVSDDTVTSNNTALKAKLVTVKKIAAVRKYNQKIVPFKDTDDQAWYTPYVASVKSRGIISGYKNNQGKELGEFRPANNVTVAEALKISLETGNKGKAVSKTPKLRAAVNHWAKEYVAKAEELGLDLTKSDIDLNRPATRGEVIRMMLEAVGVTPPKVTKIDFSDVSVSDKNAAYIQYAKELGIISGDSGKTTFRPNASINRAEVAKIAEQINAIIIGGWDSLSE